MSIGFDKDLYEYSAKMCQTLFNRMSNYQLWTKITPYYDVDIEIHEVRDFILRESFLNPIQLLAILTGNTINFEKLVFLLKNNRIITVIGTQGLGKTSFSLTCYEKLKEAFPDTHLITNIRSVETPKTYVHSDEELQKALTELGDVPKVVILDEALKHLNLYTSAFSRRVNNWINYATDVRKYNAILILISPLFDVLFKTLKRFTRMIIQKLNLTSAAVWLSNELFPYLLTDIPNTKIPFNTLEIAEWLPEPKKEEEKNNNQKEIHTHKKRKKSIPIQP